MSPTSTLTLIRGLIPSLLLVLALIGTSDARAQSAKNSFVASIEGSGGGMELYLIDKKGGVAPVKINISSDIDRKRYPALSPDHSKIVFAGQIIGKRDIDLYVWDLDKRQLTRITDLSKCERVVSGAEACMFTEPDWSNTEQIAARVEPLAGEHTGPGSIVVMDTQGGNMRLITSDGVNREPRWHPIDNRVVFASTRERNFDIWTMDLTSKMVCRITTESSEDRMPVWTFPGIDGKRTEFILFVSNRDGNREIYSAELQYGGGGKKCPRVKKIVRLTNNSVDDLNPTIDSYIYAAAHRRGSESLHVFEATSGNEFPPALKGTGGTIEDIDWGRDRPLR